MGRLSDDVIHQLLGARFGNRALPAIANYYIGLSMQPLADDGTGEITVDSAQGYAPAVLPNDSTSWSVPAGRGVYNAVEVVFPASLPTALGGTGWGTPAAYTVRADAADGPLVAWGLLPPTLVIAGAQLQVPVGLIVIASPVPVT